MKIRFSFIIAASVLGLWRLTDGQCPQICDNGIKNTALGFQALPNSSGGGYSNTAVGYQAMLSNTDGDFNTAYGTQALLNLSVGSLNTAIGAFSLANDISGWDNTAVGYEALSSSTTAAGNTALGSVALSQDTTGFFNTAAGSTALTANTTGNNNSAFGNAALSRNTTGSGNIAIGEAAGSSLTTGDNNIDIGNQGALRESNTIRIGKNSTQIATYIAAISGTTIAGGVGVLIDTKGHLGTNTSSARFKENILPMDKASEAILALNPVTFRYKHELDPDGIPQFGLVAEEVVKVNPELVARDDQGKPFTVRYEAVNAMLLNEFLKEHRKVEKLERRDQEQEATIAQVKSTAGRRDATITRLESVVAQQQKEISTLTSQIRKVSDQLELNRAAPQVVADN